VKAEQVGDIVDVQKISQLLARFPLTFGQPTPIRFPANFVQ
jgi:hypothetical protein